MKSGNIVVVGDICIDWIYHTYSRENPRDKNEVVNNWENDLNTKIYNLPGGVMLLKEFIQHAAGDNTISFNLPGINSYPSDKMINSLAEISKFSGSKKGESSFRISKFLGYTGPAKSERFFDPGLTDKIKSMDLLVIDDAGNGFRNNPGVWEQIIDSVDDHTSIIYKMSWPLFEGELFKNIISTWPNQLTLIINADDLRKEGFNISRKLSWERTILDFIIKLRAFHDHKVFQRCPNVLVRFGLEGVIHYFAKDLNDLSSKEAVLHYYPNYCEDELTDKTAGKMQGLGAAFTAGLVHKLYHSASEDPSVADILQKAVPNAMKAVHRLLKAGFINNDCTFKYPLSTVFDHSDGDDPVIFKIPAPGGTSLKMDDWSILYEETQMKSDLELAMDYVVHGPSAELKNIPIVHFQKLVLIDRNEVEKFRTVQNLMKDYFINGKTDQPLSIGVFGPPGSGKSFGVKQLVRDIMGTKVSSHEFNLSQFQTINELIRALHKVRDFTLRGEVPLIFFDEFDAEFNGQALGWLKYFLAPMQDGEFRDGDAVHPIGKAIFIFAGGTSSSFEDFSRENEGDPDKKLLFKNAKGPDFVSRLKGYVNITGINQTNISDRLYVIRRAILLRAMLMGQKNIVDEKGKLYIDEDVLRAMLVVPEYKHGSRSIGALIGMSMLGGRTKFEKACLPPAQQLDLHVDGDIFSRLLDRDLFFAMVGEELAMEVHRRYLVNENEEGSKTEERKPAMHQWEDLNEELKASNRRQAYDMLVKLLQVKCFYVKGSSANEKSEKFEFSPEEVELLAEMEHKRWNSEKIGNGWKYGPVRDDENKIHDCLVKWRVLPEAKKNLDRNTIRTIPELFESIGYRIYRISN